LCIFPFSYWYKRNLQTRVGLGERERRYIVYIVEKTHSSLSPSHFLLVCMMRICRVKSGIVFWWFWTWRMESCEEKTRKERVYVYILCVSTLLYYYISLSIPCALRSAVVLLLIKYKLYTHTATLYLYFESVSCVRFVLHVCVFPFFLFYICSLHFTFVLTIDINCKLITGYFFYSSLFLIFWGGILVEIMRFMDPSISFCNLSNIPRAKTIDWMWREIQVVNALIIQDSILSEYF